jgi:cytochrome c-type biogenesis protein CcsB
LEFEFILFLAGASTYLLSAIAFIIAFISPKNKVTATGIWLSVAGVTLNGLSLIARWISSGHPPLAGTYETLSLLSFFIGIVFIFIIKKKWVKAEALGVSVLPLITVFMLVAFINYSEAGALAVSLRSIWLFIHVPIAIFSYALFAVAAVGGILYLLKNRKSIEDSESDKLPDLKVIDNMIYRSVAGGFILLTIAIVTGAVWAENAWGSYWSWDPKETWSLITWFVYAIFLHTRLVKGWRGKKTSIIAIIGFIAVIFTYFGVNLIGGLHSY